MPKYDISNNYVVCEIQGKILDENFAKILVNNSSLTLQDIILLDKVQKHKPITDDALTRLRSKGYVEGRKPNVYLSAKLAKDSKNPGLKSSYIKNKGFNDSYFKNLILEFIQKYGRASRTELEELLMDKLSDAMSEQQKINKITNLLASLRKGKKIIIGEKRLWYLVQQK